MGFTIRALNAALESGRTGTPTDWHNPGSGSSGAVTPLSDHKYSGGRTCRMFRRIRGAGGVTEIHDGTACRQADGWWAIRDEHPVSLRPYAGATEFPDISGTSTSAGPSSSSTTDVQELLTQIGYDPGPIDGAFGPRTAAAIRAFESDQGLAEQGQVSEGLIAQLRDAASTDLEKRALSEGTDSAGGFTVPDILSARLIDLMRNRSQVIRAGAQTVPLTSDQHYIAKLATDPIPAWRSEGGAVAESDPTFTRIQLVPRSLSVLTKVSRELFEDSLNLAEQLPVIMAKAMAVELDRVALWGSGIAPEPTGVINTANIATVAHDATLTSYAPLVSARTKLTENNFDGPTAYIMNPSEEGTLAGLTATDNQPLMMPPVLQSIPMLTSNNVPDDATLSPTDSTIIAGVFPHLLIGMRTEVRILVLKERYADNLQYGLLAYMRADIAVEYPGAFCAITGINP